MVAGASSATDSNLTLGTASASANFRANIGSPVLRATAASSSTGRLGATAIAVQRYENTGAAALTAFFGGDLSFSLTDVPDTPSVFTGYDSGIVPYITSTEPGMPIPLSTPGITVDSGESFFILARLLAIGAEGANADASSTLVTRLFDSMDTQNRELLGDDSGIVATQTVPLPGTAALLLIGFAGLVRRRLAHPSRH